MWFKLKNEKLNCEYISSTQEKDANQSVSIIRDQTRANELKWQFMKQ